VLFCIRKFFVYNYIESIDFIDGKSLVTPGQANSGEACEKRKSTKN
jgi:hypothetical protein